MSTVMVKFGELLEYPLRSGVTVSKDRRGVGIKMINMGELFRYPRLGDVEMALVNIDHVDADRFLVQPGDLLFARRSLTLEGAGKCAIVNSVPTATTWESSIIRARLTRKKANPHFYFYLFRSPLGRRLMESIVEQVAVAGVRISDLRELLVPHPSLREQDAVVDVLGVLDEKISVNESIAITVDDLASSLYRRAVEGSGAMRSIPLGEIADVNRVATKPKEGGMLRYVDIAAVGVGTYDWPARVPWSEAPGRARRKAFAGDTIWSTVRPNRRSHALVLDTDHELVFSTGLAVLSPRSVGPALLYEVTRTVDFQNYLEKVAEGSAYPAVRAERFKQAPVVLPAPEDCDKFEAVVMDLRLRSHQAKVESRTLASLRDTLLSQLMSGKLRVRDAEKIVEDAV
ncbi:hypothetical protein [Streptomyces sp. NPDC059883]|uniref:hypothetical protein n=1 Tax=unclassified Streptomyces TaxID=2593676 RepID=UPI00364832A1